MNFDALRFWRLMELEQAMQDWDTPRRSTARLTSDTNPQAQRTWTYMRRWLRLFRWDAPMTVRNPKT
ncbi:hypothetical protein [Acetobacter cerevisiae]|uniref:hypothetical protein n=1 Tax=Acetobacter cerevisiae TaxID=178900 RepID=UPI0012E7DBD9|nr:hypothetical protein [Acetobacter cerevisiae]